tara:strand:+ start:64 stop:354 length:291 start_codon:yes stop_codon:yes gene_type:complete
MTSIIKGNLTTTIKIEDTLKDEGKGAWTDITDETLVEMFADFIVNNNNDDAISSEFCFHKTKDADFYATKYPGFSDEVYQILENEQEKLNKMFTTD